MPLHGPKIKGPRHLRQSLLAAALLNRTMSRSASPIVIIGAGMAGLTAARRLRGRGLQAIVIDKSRGVGGRMATRRIDGAVFDHGAQFFTAREPEFAAEVQKWLKEGAAVEWHRGFNAQSDGHPRYRGAPGMTGVAKRLAAGLEIRQEARAEGFQETKDGWVITMASGESLRGQAAILTPPAPQSLELLDAGEVCLSDSVRARLEAITFERCFAVMAALDGPSGLSAPGVEKPDSDVIAWIADNQIKGVSERPSLTIHATPEFSLKHWDHDRDATARAILDAARPWIQSEVASSQIHGWKFAKPAHIDRARCLVVKESPPLVIAGDAFGGPRVEGAALSGRAAADVIADRVLG